jgi:hypothetical protein
LYPYSALNPYNPGNSWTGILNVLAVVPLRGRTFAVSFSLVLLKLGADKPEAKVAAPARRSVEVPNGRTRVPGGEKLEVHDVDSRRVKFLDVYR